MSEHTLNIQIVAHEKRRDMATRLASDVGADGVWVDSGFYGEWKNHVRAWKKGESSEATHVLVLQDDAVPVVKGEDFRNEVIRAIDERPEDVISLYVGTHRPRKAQVIQAVAQAESLGASWLVCEELLWGVGVVIPRDQINNILVSARRVSKPYDQRLGSSVSNVYYTYPSLVDHADVETVAHVGLKQQGVRVAHKVGIPIWSKVSPVRIDMSPGVGLASTKDRVR